MPFHGDDEVHMKTFTFVATISAIVFGVSCNNSPVILPDVEPTPNLGADGGISSCDACDDRNGTRIVHEREVSTSADGFKFVKTVGYFDLLLNELCMPLKTEDSIVRCLPVNAAVFEDRYSDLNCKAPIASMMAECGQVLPSYAIRKSVGKCGEITHYVSEVGLVYGGPIFHVVNGMCTSTAKDPNLIYFQVGSHVSPMNFVEIKNERVH